MTIFSDRILRHRKITKKKSDTLWNINLKVPAKSMKRILMLFEDPDRTSTEDFVNPKVTKVEITIVVCLISCTAKVYGSINSGTKSTNTLY